MQTGKTIISSLVGTSAMTAFSHPIAEPYAKGAAWNDGWFGYKRKSRFEWF